MVKTARKSDTPGVQSMEVPSSAPATFIPMKVLTLNAGSSSLKYKLFRADGLELLASGAAERIGEAHDRLVHRWRTADGEWQERTFSQVAPSHDAALEHTLGHLSEVGMLLGRSELMGVGHRVVHGGERFVAPTVIDDANLPEVRAAEHLAPLHNPANVRGIEVGQRMFQGIPQVAVFDTAFHHTLPPHVFHYALASHFRDHYHVRRYGFHGTSVQYVVRRLGELMERPMESLNAIVLHLGNGASATAVANGRSVDTSMGMTPLEGLVMGTRCGDLDPAIPFHLLRHAQLTPEQLEHSLSHESGLKGVCGTNDMREVHARIAQGDADAALALDMFCYRVKKYVGAYAAALGRVDAVAFTAGIGEHDADVRARSLAGLEAFGLSIDAQRNSAATAGIHAIHADGSRIQIWVIPTDEEREIARCVIALLQRQ